MGGARSAETRDARRASKSARRRSPHLTDRLKLRNLLAGEPRNCTGAAATEDARAEGPLPRRGERAAATLDPRGGVGGLRKVREDCFSRPRDLEVGGGNLRQIVEEESVGGTRNAETHDARRVSKNVRRGLPQFRGTAQGQCQQRMRVPRVQPWCRATGPKRAGIEIPQERKRHITQLHLRVGQGPLPQRGERAAATLDPRGRRRRPSHEEGGLFYSGR